MKITVACVGKIKEKYFTDAIAEYSKRLGAYCSFEIVQVNDEKCPETLSPREEEQVKDAEGERLLAKIKESSYIVALVIEGKAMSSPQLAKAIENIALMGNSHITFVIGGSLGLSQKIISKADLKLSFSPMTFPHQLMRVILLEQIYRAFRIIKGEPYHK